MVWPALIGAGAAILGSVLGSKAQRDANQENIENQREFAQHGIRWKVEDAKAAGLHPLFALGGSGATFSPSSQPVFNGAELGQNLSRAASAFSSTSEQALKAANLKALEAQADRDFAAASAYRSEAARLGQSQVAPVAESFPVAMPGQAVNGLTLEQQIPGGYSAVDQGTSLAPAPAPGPSYLTADVKPGFQRFNTAVAGEVILPSSSSMSEAVESMENPAIQLWIISENLKHYGPGAERKLRALLGDKYKWWTNPGGAVRDSVRSFGRSLNKWGGN